MTSNHLEKIRKHLSNLSISEGLEGEVHAYILRRIDDLKEQFDNVTLGSVATALSWTESEEGCKAIVNVLDSLTYGYIKIFYREFSLWGDSNDEVMQEPIAILSSNDVRKALEENCLYFNGTPIDDFLDRITVMYVVRNDVFKESNNKDFL